MSESISGKTLSTDEAQEVRRVCQEFETAWQKGKFPILDDYLGDFDGATRELLVRELTAIEARYRHESVMPSEAAAEVTLELPGFSAAATAGRSVTQPTRQESRVSQTASRSLPTQGVDAENTVAYTNQSITPTGGLLIRCPHCCNGVELLSETPFEDITCHDCGSTFNLVDREKLTTAAKAPKSIGRFNLEEKLGAGGFGTVWKARDTELDRVVAIKIPRKGQLSLIDVEQFYREARAAAQLRHPNIVPVHEVGREADTVFIVSDLITGVSLSDWMTERKPNVRDTAQLAVVVADALHHAHQQGIIHRDLKPSNVMVDGANQPHLMDFGLARREVGEVTMTVDGQILGTPTYMSPEQAGGQGHWADRRTDIYSFGVMLFKMLTDELPFRGSIQRQIQQRLTEDAPDPRTLNRFIPRDLSTICLKCLERDPNRRYSTAQELAEELRRFLRGEPIKARPISRIARLGRWAKRKPAAATAVALTIFLAIAGPTAAVRIEQQRRDLAATLAEKNNVIAQSAKDAQRDTAEIKELQGELDLWTGRANPWKFWPPQAASNPRITVLTKFFDQKYQPLAQQLEAGNYSDRELALGNWGLAVMAHSLKKEEIAEQHYLAARAILRRLVEVEPKAPDLQIALARCNTKLAEIYGSERKKEALAALAEASQIYEGLSSSEVDNSLHRIDWIESEFNSSVLAGFESDLEHLLRTEQIEETLESTWPKDPIAAASVAAYLAEEPLIQIEKE